MGYDSIKYDGTSTPVADADTSQLDAVTMYVVAMVFFVKRRCRSENLGSHRMPHLTITFHDQHQFSEDPVVIISHQKIWP
jgi:hypothetical protein